MERLIGIDEVAAILGVGSGTLYKWVWQKKIPYLKVNGALRFRPSELEAFISAKNQPPKQTVKASKARKLDTNTNLERMLEQAKAEAAGPGLG